MLYELGWWLLRHFDQDVQDIFFAFLWWALVLLNAHVGEFKFTGYSFLLKLYYKRNTFVIFSFCPAVVWSCLFTSHLLLRWLIFLFCWKIRYNVIGERACSFPFLCFPSLFYFLLFAICILPLRARVNIGNLWFGFLWYCDKNCFILCY